MRAEARTQACIRSIGLVLLAAAVLTTVGRWTPATTTVSAAVAHSSTSTSGDLPFKLVNAVAGDVALGDATATTGYDHRSQLARASARLDAYRSAPRALPAARQVDAAWGPARQYAHGPGPMTAIEHINYRHAFNSGFDDVSRFAQGTSARQIQGYVDDALRYGDVTQGGASIRYDLGRTIGLDQAGNPVTGIQVWVRDGYIRTAYPVAP